MPLPTITGLWRVGSDPDLKFSPSGVGVCKFRAVASSAKKEDDGSWTTTGEIWVTCIAFYELAEHCINTVVKGQQVRLVGQIQNREYDKDDGSKGYALEILLDAVHPVHVRGEQTAGGSNSGSQPAPTNQAEEPPF
jgi:single-strand DNA-binding protein